MSQFQLLLYLLNKLKQAFRTVRKNFFDCLTIVARQLIVDVILEVLDTFWIIYLSFNICSKRMVISLFLCLLLFFNFSTSANQNIFVSYSLAVWIIEQQMNHWKPTLKNMVLLSMLLLWKIQKQNDHVVLVS